MRVGYINEIVEEQLLASSEASGYPIENILTNDMTTKYKSATNGSLNISFRNTSTSGIINDLYYSGSLQSSVGTDVKFGSSVAISGDYSVVGAPDDSTYGTDAGAVHLYRKTGIIWNLTSVAFATDPEANDNFGVSVGIDGDYVIVGANGEDTGGSASGAAYIFHRTGVDTWDSGVKIVASDAAANDNFGISVSIAGDYAVVGAFQESTGIYSYSGAVYVFHRTGTNTWDSGVKLVSSSPEDNAFFGVDVDISGDYIVVGASGESIFEGSAYVFHRTGTTTWDAGTNIVSSDTGASGDQFGNSVNIVTGGTYDIVVVGSKGDDSGKGAVHFYHRTGTNTWDSGYKVIASDGQTNDFFGEDISMSGNYLVVGAFAEDGGSGDPVADTGAIYLYEYNSGTQLFTLVLRQNSDNTAVGEKYGSSVAIDGMYVMIGSPLIHSSKGMVYTYTGDTLPSPVSMACINAHNIGENDTVILKGYADDTTSTASVEHTFEIKEYGMAIIFDEETYFWEIDLEVDNPIEIGSIFLGTHLITPAYEIGSKTEWITNDKYTISKSGQLFGDEGYYKRIADYLLPYITVDEADDWLTFFKSVGTRNAFYLLQFPGSQDRQPLFYCHLRNNTYKLEEHEGNRSLFKNVPFQIEEVF